MKQKPELVGEQARIDAYAFLNRIIKSKKLEKQKFESLKAYCIHCLDDSENTLHLNNVPDFCKLLGMKCIREDWDGNKHTGANWDICYFMYKGYKIFSLETKL